MNVVSFKKTVIVLSVTLFCALYLAHIQDAAAQASSKQQELVDKARITFQSFMCDQSMTWLHENYPSARGLIIVPSQIKGGFFVGGSGGSGVLIARDPESGQWSHPGFYTIGSVSFGLQIGGEAAEMIMVVRTDRALTKLYTSSMKLGGDVSAAVGPVGAGAKAAVTADIVTFTRSKGAYVGASLEGLVIKIRHKWNKAYYGKPVQPIDIFVKRNVSNPNARGLIQAVSTGEKKR
jgi:lipid-binding SYLF domain-containing protein